MTHDERCEAEYVPEAPGWTDCGCPERAATSEFDALELAFARLFDAIREAFRIDQAVEWLDRKVKRLHSAWWSLIARLNRRTCEHYSSTGDGKGWMRCDSCRAKTGRSWS